MPFMDYIFPAPTQPSLPIQGQSVHFPVNRIFCVGQNYADHVKEMGGNPDRGHPIFFDKSPSCLVPSGSMIPYPLATENLHHEVELAVALRSGGCKIAIQDAANLVLGYAVALDMTRRDLQAAAKKTGKPWDMGKGFDQSAPCGDLKLMENRLFDQGAITLAVNGQTRQSGNLSQMIWNVAEIVSELSGLITLQPGDLILTGTPSGVGPVEPGDWLRAEIEGVGSLDVTYGQPVSARAKT